MTDFPTHGRLIMDADDPAAIRLRKRRNAETRMKAYGILAIVLSIAALVVLLSSVVFQATSALTETYVVMDVELAEEELDPKGARDPKEILRADFAGLTKSMMRSYFPQVTSRKDKRALNDILSVGAAYELADYVSANPDIVGTIINFDFLASDVTDLYLKGSYGRLNERNVSGAVSITVDDDEVTITSTAEDFAGPLDDLKRSLVGDAALIREQAALQQAGVEEFVRRLSVAETDDDKAAAQAQIDARSAARDQLIAQANDLEARAIAAGGIEALKRSQPSLMIKVGSGWVKLTEIGLAEAKGELMSPLGADQIETSDWSLYQTELPEESRKVSDKHIVWVETLQNDGKIEQVFNWRFLTSGDSREPELAGIWGAVVGSFWTMLVTFCLTFPIGVAAAIYLEEYAKKNAITDFLEVNINNLAAVPSIVFGLLGLAAFIQFFGVPRSAPLVGGLVLALMTLPTIIIASRVAIAAVPPSIRDAALGVGASRTQTTFHHVLPLAMPGILTGAILGMARALGETAPLILIGMVAFIVDIPKGINDSASVLPVQIFRWSDFPERAFEARTAAAICVLLVFLAIMNALAVVLRRRFERRW